MLSAMSQYMNIIFLGSNIFSLRCLDLLTTPPGINISGVVTAPEKFSISYRPQGVVNVLHGDVQGYCREKGMPCQVLSQGMKDERLFEQIKEWKPDMFVVVGWHHMVPSKWLDLAPAYGLHASLLPDYSGGAPLVWAMINGEKETGITFFQFSEGVDNGPIVGQARTKIRDDDTIATLYARIEDLGLELLGEFIPKLATGTAKLVVQDESRRRIFPQRGPEDGVIDWQWNAIDIYNFVRAQTRPYPGAFTTWNGQQIMIWSSRPVSDEQEQALAIGQFLNRSNSALVNTGSGILEIYEAAYEQRDVSGKELKRIIGGGAILGT